MTLRELCGVLPSYVTINAHTKEEAWELSAGLIVSEKDDALPEAYVVSAVPLGSYRMEVSIKFQGVA